MNKTRIVAKRVYLKNLKSPSYLWMIIAPFIFLLIGGVIVFGSVKIQEDKQTARIAIVASPEISQLVDETPIDEIGFKTQVATGIDQAETLLADQKIQGILEINDDFSQVKYTRDTGADNVVSPDQVDSKLTPIKNTYLGRITGMSSRQLDQLQMPVKSKNTEIKIVDGQIKKQSGDADAARIVTQVLSIFLFFLLSIYVSIVANEIGTEKGSRIIEGILSAVPARQHFAGKILAIFGLILTQLVLYAALAAVAWVLFLPNNIKEMVTLPNTSLTFWLVTSGLTLLTLIMIITVAAILGSLVSRQEQIQQAASPAIYLVMVPYLLSFLAVNMPNNILIRILSFVPFFSSTLMPIRMGVAGVSWVQGLISLLIGAVFAYILYRFAVNVYSKRVLDYSDKKPLQVLAETFKKS